MGWETKRDNKEGERIKRNGGDGIGKSDGGICVEEDNNEREGMYLVQVEEVVAAGGPLVLSNPVPHLPVPPRVPVHRTHPQDPRSRSPTNQQSIILCVPGSLSQSTHQFLLYFV